MTIIDEVRGPALTPSADARSAGARPTGAPSAQPARPTARQGVGWSTRLVDKLGSLLVAKTSRRGFLASTAVVGAAVVTTPKTYALTPTTAYQSICGGSSACSNGYTAFCCTINAGKNTCPPGSLAGGWWKADGSGFCCGGARYYLDCHYTCTNCSTGCGGYKSYCRAGCHPGTCTCATGDCDKRRTNCNYFRYGQCNTHIPCTGPVLCRVITCTPPWKQFDCTSAVLVDNNTRTHSASCLPGTGCLPTIDQWWWDHGGPGNDVGNPVDGAVVSLANGVTKRNFSAALVFDLPGIVVVRQPFQERYNQVGAERSALGLPVANWAQGPDGGWVQQFRGGMITWLSPTTDVVIVAGENYRRFSDLGGVNNLGYPISLGEAVSGGVRDITTRGRAYTRGGVTHVLPNDVVALYLAHGEAAGALGWPTGQRFHGLKDPVEARAGRNEIAPIWTFERGTISRDPATGQLTVTVGV